MIILEKGFPKYISSFFCVLYVDLLTKSPAVTVIPYEYGKLAHKISFINAFHTTLLRYGCFFVLKCLN